MSTVEAFAWRALTLERCSFYSRQAAKAEHNLVEHVDAARQAGCSWEEIGTALGTSRQAAISRFARRVTHVDLREKSHPRRASLRAMNDWKDPRGAT